MSKSRTITAGNAGASGYISLNGNQGGGSKKQGLPPYTGHNKYNRSYGKNRDMVFSVNQLGGIGKGRSTFSPSADGVHNLTRKNLNKNSSITLFYKLRDINGQMFVDTLDFTVDNSSTSYRGITITSLTNQDFSPIENTSVVFIGYRVPTTNTGNWVKNIYVEQFTITDTEDDEFSASKVYQDEADGFETTVSFVKYNIIYATGKYSGRTTATIFFDNLGTGFGNCQTFARRIEIQ
jgi:hypothetical protein